MPPSTTDKKHLFKALWLTFLYLAFPLAFFVIGVMGYLNEEFIEHKLQTLNNDERFYLPLLLFLPIGMLVITMCVLVWRSRRDHDSDRFYSFCLLMMSLTPCSYCILWSLYVYGGLDKYPSVLSISAFVLILVLVLLVIYLTYVIMWNPERPSFLLNVSDIKDDRWETFCGRLHDNFDRSLSKQNSFSLVSLFPDDANLRAAIRDRNIRPGQRHDVIDALNGLFRRSDLSQAEDFNNVDKLDRNGINSPHHVQRYNRNLFDTAFAAVLRKRLRLPPVVTVPQGWLARQRDSLKIGVTKSPFWAIVFFFATFLGVTYLFAFAFAFHDKANLQTEKKPSLFAPRSGLYNVGEYPVSPTGSGESSQNQSVRPIPLENEAPVDIKGRWPGYLFYFDSYSGNPRFKESFDQQRFDELLTQQREHEQAEEELRGDGSKKRSEIPKKRLSKSKLKEVNDSLSPLRVQWREWKNWERLDRLVNAILLEDKATHGQGLLIQVRGSADDKKPKRGEEAGVNYPSNYTLSEARAQAITYVLLEKLAKSGNLQSNFRWVILPLSNENLSIPASPQEVRMKQQRGNPETNDELSMLAIRINKMSDDPAVEENQRASLTSYLNRIGKLADGKKVDDSDVHKLTEKLQSYLLLMSQIGTPIKEERDAQNETRNQVQADLEESLAAIELDLIDRDAAKRSVVVTLKPAQQNQSHLFTPLSLMDYMYFTIYTITTTGYGDIVPATTYAKFLCSAANILEVFFFVVFFNGLLSITKSRESPVAEEESYPANINTMSSSPKQTGKDSEMDLSQIRELVKKNEELLKEVRSTLEKIPTRPWWRPW